VAPDHDVTRSEHAHLLVPAYEKEAGLPILEFLERVRGRGRRRAARVASAWRLGSGDRDDSAWRL
jgi:hypothetical protein